MNKKKKAFILGAGPTGLITAWKLLEANWDVTIIEKKKVSGGLCRSWKWKNFIIDTGPHIFHTPEKLLKEFWKKHFGDLLIEGKFSCKNVQGENFEKFYDYPLSFEGLNKLDKKLKNRINKELKNCNKNDKRYKAKNYKEYIDSFVGPTLRKMFFEKYPKKIWGVDTKDMTPDCAPNRINLETKFYPFTMRNMLLLENMGPAVYMIELLVLLKRRGEGLNLEKISQALKQKRKKF